MAYKILYIDDLETVSREKDIKNLGFNVKLYNPTSNLKDLFSALEEDTDASILDYRLTKGRHNACFDAPTIAQTLRTKHKEDLKDFPLVLMSNEDIKVSEYDKDLTSQDLFDFVLTKQEFSDNKELFKCKLNSFIEAYKEVRIKKFCLKEVLDFKELQLHSRLHSKITEIDKNTFKFTCFVYYDIVKSIGLLIGEDVLSARLGVSKDSKDWSKLLQKIQDCLYTGVFSQYHKRWWMEKINYWWSETVNSKVMLRKLEAEERIEILRSKFEDLDLTPIEKTKHSVSSNFWTICKESKKAIDPFDGIELIKDYYPWQEKEYLSFESALEKIEDYKNIVSKVDKKAIREIVDKERVNG